MTAPDTIEIVRETAPVPYRPALEAMAARNAAIADGTVDVHRMCDWVDNAIALNGINPKGLFGWMSLKDVKVRSCTRRAKESPGFGRAS